MWCGFISLDQFRFKGRVIEGTQTLDLFLLYSISPIPCLYEFSANLTTKDLSRSIQSLVGNSSQFILVLWEFSPVYVLFQMESLDDFLPSYSTEFTTRDLTLFFQDQEKVLDLHLAEDKVEVRVLENKAKNP